MKTEALICGNIGDVKLPANFKEWLLCALLHVRLFHGKEFFCIRGDGESVRTLASLRHGLVLLDVEAKQLSSTSS